MEDFSQVYTLEFKGEKGWEVMLTFTGLNDAINAFRHHSVNDTDVAWRLTTPTND